MRGVWKGMEDNEDGRKIEDKEDDEETGFCPVDNVKASDFTDGLRLDQI